MWLLSSLMILANKWKPPRWDCSNITSAQKWHSDIFQISAEKRNFLHFLNACREVLPDDFYKLQPPKLYENVQEPFCQAWKLFSTEIWKMLECHFWADVMLGQSTFCIFWSTQMVDIYIFELSHRETDEKAQCDTVLI